MKLFLQVKFLGSYEETCDVLCHRSGVCSTSPFLQSPMWTVKKTLFLVTLKLVVLFHSPTGREKKELFTFWFEQTGLRSVRVEFDTSLKMFSYLASRNFLSLLGRSWFLRCLNHLWTCRTEQPICLLKLSTELWQHKQEKGVINWQKIMDLSHMVWAIFPQFSPFYTWNRHFWTLGLRLVLCYYQSTQYVWGSAGLLKCAGWLPVWDALMCGRNSPPGQDLEEHKHVFCHARPAVRQEALLPSWKEENAV